jgi:hypothetical protein
MGMGWAFSTFIAGHPFREIMTHHLSFIMLRMSSPKKLYQGWWMRHLGAFQFISINLGEEKDSAMPTPSQAFP